MPVAMDRNDDVDVNFSFCLIIFVGLNEVRYFYNGINFQINTSFCQLTNMASSGVWENVLLAKTPRCVGACVSIKYFSFN